MATHSSVLAWRTPWTEKPGSLRSTGSQSRTGPKGLSAQTCGESAKGWQTPRGVLDGTVWLVVEAVLVTQLCLTLGDPMDCSPPGFSVHGILQARILEQVAFPFSRGSS